MKAEPVLSVINGRAPDIHGESAESLIAFLAPVGDASIEARIGQERVIDVRGQVLMTRGQVYRTRQGSTHGGRYINRDESGRFFSVLNYTVIDGQAVVSNIYTHPDFRRQGLAMSLIKRVREDMPNLVVDDCMSAAGAALFGYRGPSLGSKRFSPG